MTRTRAKRRVNGQATGEVLVGQSFLALNLGAGATSLSLWAEAAFLEGSLEKEEPWAS